MISVSTPSELLAGRAEAQLPALLSSHVASRIFAKDSTLWGEAAQAEASIRLNWLDAPARGAAIVAKAKQLAESLRSEGITRVVLSGMGGSSLAPEVIAAAEGLELVTLDSTDPEQIRAALVDLESTVLVNSSKSGSTVETDSHRRIFEQEFERLGINPKHRIVFVTDPGSPLAKDTAAKGFSAIFEADPDIGGRFSALSAFGIVPTVLNGGSMSALLDDAAAALPLLAADSSDNPALVLAAALAQKNPQQNKLIIAENPATAIGLGDWIEQLIAESTGKEETGILPVIVEADAPELSSQESDQIILWLGSVASAAEHGISPDIIVEATLGEHFMLWEYATSVMGVLLGINPFDQPDVESAKNATRALLDSGIAPVTVTELLPGLALRAAENLDVSALENLESAELIPALLKTLLAAVGEVQYLSIQAYLDRPALPEYTELRALAAKKTGRPTTFGWGPRFLHSTGQFHKGGQQQGVFLQLLSQNETDLAIPGRDFTFAELLGAQADGDRNVLAAKGRPVLSLIVTDPVAALAQLRTLLKG
ncbi:MAG: glucose-6-phosphate isomerase [Microbacteriaceae bacterium]